MRMKTKVTLWIVALVLLVSCLGCVDVLTKVTKDSFDTNAVTSRQVADSAALGQLTPLESAYYFECYARAFQNLSNGGHWKPATFSGHPIQPTTLPWVPQGGLSGPGTSVPAPK
jgi:hypothetical protein